MEALVAIIAEFLGIIVTAIIEAAVAVVGAVIGLIHLGVTAYRTWRKGPPPRHQ
jgi:hypothetical protein